MATIIGVYAAQENGMLVGAWAALTETNADGRPQTFPRARDMSVQFTGNFGTGGHVTLQGSNDGTNFIALKDKSNTTIDATAAGIFAVTGQYLQIRPFVTAGTGVSVAATVVAVHE